VFESEIAAAKKRIADRLPELIDAQVDLALGVTVHEVDEETGGVRVYTRPPCWRSAQYLTNRIMGTPTQHTEITGADGAPLTESLSDDERAARILAILERARPSGAGLPADEQSGNTP
jgi:hypothetical protein